MALAAGPAILRPGVAPVLVFALLLIGGCSARTLQRPTVPKPAPLDFPIGVFQGDSPQLDQDQLPAEVAGIPECEFTPRPELTFPDQFERARRRFNGIVQMMVDLKQRSLDSATLQMRVFDPADFVGWPYDSVLNCAAALEFTFVMFPIIDLVRDWYSLPVEEHTPERAEAVARPLVETLGGFSSLIGYDLADEPDHLGNSGGQDQEPFCRITDAFRRLDPSRPATGILIGGQDRGVRIFEACRPDTLFIDVYPFRGDFPDTAEDDSSPIGDFEMKSFFFDLDFVEYIRQYSSRKRPGQPFWIVLQTHGDRARSAPAVAAGAARHELDGARRGSDRHLLFPLGDRAGVDRP